METIQNSKQNTIAVVLHKLFELQVFRQLAKIYANAHATMSSQDTDRCGGKFADKEGIVNGAQWYSIAGGKYGENTLKAVNLMNVAMIRLI